MFFKCSCFIGFQLAKHDAATKQQQQQPAEPVASPTYQAPSSSTTSTMDAWPLQMYLSISESRGFRCSSATNGGGGGGVIYLICRLFWNGEKVRFETTSTSSQNTATTAAAPFSWTLSMSFVLRRALIDNMKSNYMILEVWQKQQHQQQQQSGSLIGTIKLPLHEFYLRFSDERLLASLSHQHLNSNNNNNNNNNNKDKDDDESGGSMPLIGVDGWLSACDPFTGARVGEVNVLLAMGSVAQVLTLSKLLFDRDCLKRDQHNNNNKQDGAAAALASGEQMAPTREHECSNHATLNIGVLRATGLDALVRRSPQQQQQQQAGGIVYVKFAPTSFLSNSAKLGEASKETRSVALLATAAGVFEFFDYFDVQCALVAAYSSTQRRTISLAEQLELGKLIFEIWWRPTTTTAADQQQQQQQQQLLGVCVVPLEPLLHNRIGVRGWMPIRAVNRNGEIAAAAATAPSPLVSSSANASVELSIRFTRSHDFLRVLEVARDIGWRPTSELLSTFSIHSPASEQQPHNNNNNNKPQTSGGDKASAAASTLRSALGALRPVKCLVHIERAVRLTMPDTNNAAQQLPNTFVSLLVCAHGDLDEQQQTKLEKSTTIELRTPLIAGNAAPVWHFERVCELDAALFLPLSGGDGGGESPHLTLRVMHVESGVEKLVGEASVDMTPLVCGLGQLSGWYNVMSKGGECRGQLKLSVTPQESLAPLRVQMRSLASCASKATAHHRQQQRQTSICLNVDTAPAHPPPPAITTALVSTSTSSLSSSSSSS